MRCKKCGAENPEESRFCGNCGAQFEPEETDSLREKPVQAKRQGKKWIWGILAVVVIAGIIAGVLILKNVQERKSYENYLDSAEKYLEELDYENAEAAYLKAIDVEPKEEEPYVALARLYLGQGETDKARTILEQGAQKASGTAKSGTHKEEEESIEDLLDDVKDAAAYTWVLDPSVQADDINYVTSQDLGRASENEVKKQKDSPYAVLRTGDRYGMIGQDGELATGMDYESVEDFFGMYILVRAEPQYEALFGQEWDLYFFDEETGQLSPAEGLGAGFNPEGFYYYCDGLCNENDDLGIEYPRNMPEEAIPVQQTSVRGTGYDFTDNSKRDSWEKELDESKYAIWYKDELVTDFIYEECGSSSDGLLAVKQNGKWGYVDQNGEIVIPIEYDASWTEYDQYIRSTASSEQMDYCYAFSEGYVPVCKDGAWALMDSDGKKVIPEGIFEAIRPVQDGKCWVKKDGYWGVIELEDKEAP